MKSALAELRRDKHILVVDDEPRIAEIARDYLERAGYTVTTAGNGVDRSRARSG